MCDIEIYVCICCSNILSLTDVINVWLFVVSGGDLSLIEGSYEYYHYLQDGVDDNVSFLASWWSWFDIEFNIRSSREKKVQKSSTRKENPEKNYLFILWYLITGSFGFFFSDDGWTNVQGWGCAYRSLQTIISWYRLQQYTAIDVPSHRYGIVLFW